MQHSTDEYVSKVNDTNISRIHERVKYVKRLQGIEDIYMTGAEWLEQSKVSDCFKNYDVNMIWNVGNT